MTSNNIGQRLGLIAVIAFLLGMGLMIGGMVLPVPTYRIAGMLGLMCWAVTVAALVGLLLTPPARAPAPVVPARDPDAVRFLQLALADGGARELIAYRPDMAPRNAVQAVVTLPADWRFDLDVFGMASVRDPAGAMVAVWVQSHWLWLDPSWQSLELRRDRGPARDSWVSTPANGPESKQGGHFSQNPASPVWLGVDFAADGGRDAPASGAVRHRTQGVWPVSEVSLRQPEEDRKNRERATLVDAALPCPPLA